MTFFIGCHCVYMMCMNITEWTGEDEMMEDGDSRLETRLGLTHEVYFNNSVHTMSQSHPFY
jgi:hypothetical protein